MNKKLIALAFAAGVGLASAPASAITVGGIIFNSIDSTGLNNITTDTLAQQFINPLTTAPGDGAGMGYGEISTINGVGSSDYCAIAGCRLYYTVSFYGGTFTSPTDITFTGTDVNIYYLNSATNLLSQSSAANLALIQGGTLYASLKGHGNIAAALPAGVVSRSKGDFTGLTGLIQGDGLLDVDLGAAGHPDFENYLNGGKMPDVAGGFADILYSETTSNAVRNQFDNTAGCSDGSAATGTWCLQGSLTTQGVGVPEPGTLALIALGLLGGGLVRRRRS